MASRKGKKLKIKDPVATSGPPRRSSEATPSITEDTQIPDLLLKYLETCKRGYEKNPEAFEFPKWVEFAGASLVHYHECMKGVELAALARDGIQARICASHAARCLATAMLSLADSEKHRISLRGNMGKLVKRELEETEDPVVREATDYYERQKKRSYRGAASHTLKKLRNEGVEELPPFDTLRKRIPRELAKRARRQARSGQ